ncbi:MAG: hypothetical protein OHK0015_16190 [Chloroflexi bacterium OHK40]
MVRGFLIEFNLYYPDDGGNVGFDSVDFGYVELYRIDDNGFLIDEVPGDQFVQGIVVQRIDVVPQPNTWYRVPFFFAQDPNDPNDDALFNSIKGQRVALVFDQDGDRLPPYENAIIDNPQVTVCPTAQPPDRAIEGFVAVQGLPLAGQGNVSITTASLGLLYREGPGATPQLVRVTNPFESGYYRFRGLPSLPPGGSYQVLYLNSGYEREPPADGGQRMAYYAGPLVTSFSDTRTGGYYYGWGGYFDLSDIFLGGPEHYAEVAGTVSFSWTPRSFNGDTALEDGEQGYFLCFYDPTSFAEVCTTSPIEGGSIAVKAADLTGIPGFSFELGKTVGWYVMVAGPGYDPVSPAFDGLGASRYSRFVTFVEAVDIPAPSPPEGGEMPGDPAEDDDSWTLMFYLAGDDPQLTTPSGNTRSLINVLTNLLQLPDSYPELNIVVQFDFYETLEGDPPVSSLEPEFRGTQRCFFAPGTLRLADACQQLGEQNTGSPQVLADFISDSLARYPADRTALIIMGHGNAVTGVAGDRTSLPDDALRPHELEQAYELANLDDDKLDLLVYYSCLMGNYETATIASRFADVMAGSPNIAALVDVTAQLGAAAASSQDPRVVAAALVEAYNDELSLYNQRYNRNLSIAMAAYDLRQLAGLRDEVNELASAITASLDLADVGNARAAVQLYDSSAPELWGFTSQGEDALIDLRHLATLLSDSSNARIRDAASNLLAALLPVGDPNGLVIASVARSGRADLVGGGTHNLSNAAGLSIYFPTGVDVGNQATLTRNYLDYYRQTSFRTGSWDELVDATRTGIPSLPRGGKLASMPVGAAGSTLMNLNAQELFPTLGAPLDETALLHLPLLRR